MPPVVKSCKLLIKHIMIDHMQVKSMDFSKRLSVDKYENQQMMNKEYIFIANAKQKAYREYHWKEYKKAFVVEIFFRFNYFEIFIIRSANNFFFLGPVQLCKQKHLLSHCQS